MTRVLITGGAGFIGHHLVRALVDEGCEVRVLDNLHRGSFERDGLAGATLIAGDVRDPAACESAVAGCDCVVHLAAQSNVMGSEAAPDYTFETNVSGVWNVARAVARWEVPRLVFASSREVYGDPVRIPVGEGEPCRPKNLYGASKVAGEALLAGGAAGGAAVVILRLANVIGPGDSERVVPNWLAAARARQPLEVYGGAQELDFVPVETCIQAIRAAMGCPPLKGPVNVGSGQPVALLRLAERVLALYGGAAGIHVSPARPAEVVRFAADVTRMKSLLAVEAPENPLASLPGPEDAPW